MQYKKLKQDAFTLVELLVVISIITMLIAILLPALSAARTAAKKMTNNTQLRGIVQDFNVFAMSNNTWYPGINGSTRKNFCVAQDSSLKMFGSNAAYWAQNPGTYKMIGGDVIWALMLNNNLFSPEYLISPGETSSDIRPVKASSAGDNTKIGEDSPNCSYATLSVGHPFTGPSTNDIGRRKEWRSNMTSGAVIISDRARVSNHHTKYTATTSIWSQSGNTLVAGENFTFASDWIGGVAFGDDHVKIFNDARVPTTQYGNVTNTASNFTNGIGDNIFAWKGGTPNHQNKYNAFMFYNDSGE